MNLNNQNNMMHFKSAKIAGLTADSRDMEQINSYALSPLDPEDIFTFKVSMAGNEIDRDHEVFPRHTLSKLANLFVGRTVVKDHDHRSDNQIARIYATELVESNPIRHTKTGEVFVELIAKCYMVKTSANADLISEIRAGIRKEVSLGCRIGKAICSICNTDNVKKYCTHFGGKKYEGQYCYFSLEDPSDAYELSFVAIPAQQHAGTVKSYGEKPCYQKDAELKEKTAEAPKENLHTRKTLNEEERRLIINRLVEEARQLLLNQESSVQSVNLSLKGAKEPKNASIPAQNAPNLPENALNLANSAQEQPINDVSITVDERTSENFHTREEAFPEEQNRLTVNREENNEPSADPLAYNQESCTQEKPCDEGNLEDSSEGEPLVSQEDSLGRAPEDDDEINRLTVNRFNKDEEVKTSDDEPCPQESILETAGDSIINSEEKAEVEEALKAKQAAARLRALELSLSLRQRNISHQ